MISAHSTALAFALFGCGLALALLGSGCVVTTHGGPGAPPEGGPSLRSLRSQAFEQEHGPAPSSEQKQSAPPDEASTKTIVASHLLVSYAGANRAGPSVKRSREEARERAEEALAQARKGEDFGRLVAEYSDEPGAALRAGALGRFSREQMVGAFADAAFALEPGEISDVVETEFGYHVILRTE